MSAWEVHKFGGTSLADATRYRNAVDIVLNNVSRDKRKCVVVSAMGSYDPKSKLVRSKSNPNLFKALATGETCKKKKDKVTSMLIKCQQLAAQRDPSYVDELMELKERHLEIVAELLSFDDSNKVKHEYNVKVRTELQKALEKDFENLGYIMKNSWLGRDFDLEHWANGYGEMWSARLMTAFINFVAFNKLNDEDVAKGFSRRAIYLDAREVIYTLKERDTPTPDIAVSTERMKKWLDESKERQECEFVVVTGYVASDYSGKPKTLGRDGSDYSASIMGALLSADSVSIWTDVDGVFSANPKIVKGAVVRKELTYSEASELAYFGAKVIHPKTMTPILKRDIPIWLRNSFDPSKPGTVIQSEHRMQNTDKVPFGVKGFSCIENLSLICVEGTGMIGVPGVAHRLFGALRNIGASVSLISQAGSEHSICICVPNEQGEMGVKAVEREFRDELEDGFIEAIDVRGPVACLAIVGEGMKSTKGVVGHLGSALSDASVNIMALAQGSSERNISVVIHQSDADKALEAVHKAFVEDAAGLNGEILSRVEMLTASIKRQQEELSQLESEMNGQ